MGVSIKDFTRGHQSVFAGLPFAKVVEGELAGWEVSLVFAGTKRARALNQKLRNKDYIPNVLSYKVGTKSGEIIICPLEAAKQAPRYEMSTRTFILYLFIHGVLHIKGRVHGATMEKWEHTLLTRYEATYSNRYRYRHVPSKDGRRRGAH